MRLEGEAFGSIPGQLRDVSVSGAFIETQLALAPMARVNVELRCRHGAKRKIPAFVIRSDAHGIAVEWRVLAPAPVVATLARAAQEVKEPQGRSSAVFLPHIASPDARHNTGAHP
jgi:hypothetical protein